MTRPYAPPAPGRQQRQAVRRRRGVPAGRRGTRADWRWALLGLLLIPVAAVALAKEAGLGGGGAPVAAPTATATLAATVLATTGPVAAAPTGRPTPTTVVTAQTGATPTAQAAATPSAGASTPVVTPSGGGARAVASGTPSGPFIAYRVQPGDTVALIAAQFGVSTESVIQASGLQHPDQLRVGQVLTIPSQPGWLYRVQPGETLDQIAARTGVSSDQIAAASNLSSHEVQSGQVILIPSSAGQGNVSK